MDKLTELKSKIEEFQAKSAFASDMKSFMAIVLKVIKDTKDDFKGISDENQTKLDKVLAYFETEHAKLENTVSQVTDNAKKDFENSLNELNKLVSEIKNTPPVIIEKTEIIRETPIVTNEIKEIAIADTGEAIVDKINSLSLEEENKIDASHIKNLPATVIKGGGIRQLQYLADVSISSPSNNQVLKYNSTNQRWENGTDVGGVPGGSDTQLQYNNAGAFGGISGATTNGTAVTFTTGNLLGADIKASSSGGLQILSNAGTVTALFGAGSGANSTFYGGSKFDYATASTIAIFDGTKNLISADTATYPSLTELSYVKGVTSSIQTQLNTLISGRTLAAVSALSTDATKSTYTMTSGVPVLFNRSGGSQLLKLDETGSQVIVGATNTVLAGLEANNPLTITGTNTAYIATTVTNKSAGGSASADFIVSADNDDGTIATGKYGDLGITSSTYNDPTVTLAGPNTTYLYANGGDLIQYTATAGKIIKWGTGGSLAANERMRLTDNGLKVGTVSGGILGSLTTPYLQLGSSGFGWYIDTSRLFMKVNGSFAGGFTSAQWIVPTGTASAPSISVNGDSNTGVNGDGSDGLGISTGGTYRMWFNSSGFVGIGTTTQSNNARFTISDTQSNLASTYIPFSSSFTYTQSSGTTPVIRFKSEVATFAGTVAGGNTIGSQYFLTVSNSGSGNDVSSLYPRLETSGSGAATTLNVLRLHFEGNGSGTITNWHGMLIGSIGAGGWSNTSATITNTYGIRIGTISGGTQTNAPYSIYSSDSTARMYHNGSVGLGVTSPTAVLHLKAGTATANTAPLKFNTGTNLTTAEAGVFEYNNTPHFTNSDATRRHIVLSDGTYTAGLVVVGGKVKMRIGGTDYNVLVE